MRQFYNEDGSIVYKEYIDDDAHVYVLMMHVYIVKKNLSRILFANFLESDDIVIIDRATDVGQAILQNKGDSKVGVVVHAEHYSMNSTDDTHILWNNYYEYQFENAKYIDFFITATDLQNKILNEQFKIIRMILLESERYQWVVYIN